MFIDKLLKKIIELKNPSVLGLDPDIEKFPEFIKEKFLVENINADNISASSITKAEDSIKNAIEFFNKCIIDEVYDIIPAVKFQAAYYEMYGPKGMEALLNSVEYARSKGMIIIIDAKRNDIGSTAKAYSNAYIGRSNIMGLEVPIYDADAITVNAYLGSDGINPFIEDCEKYDKGIFVLVKTSNPSSGEFQDIETENSKELYVRVGEKVEEWGRKLIGEYGYSSIGAVVGAT
ncbi:MAG: orotidine-5'-phosphate decarboxylase, partial [Candidatus Afipia apatlaquensis]|nr:orotidine-5'-phosphate decarboxylase [Candidatus Afipia apatlaquensis]